MNKKIFEMKNKQISGFRILEKKHRQSLKMTKRRANLLMNRHRLSSTDKVTKIEICLSSSASTIIHLSTNLIHLMMFFQAFENQTLEHF